MATSAITATQLTKRYRRRGAPALDRVDFQVLEGENGFDLSGLGVLSLAAATLLIVSMYGLSRRDIGT